MGFDNYQKDVIIKHYLALKIKGEKWNLEKGEGNSKYVAKNR